MTKIFNKEVIELADVIQKAMLAQAYSGMITAEGIAERLYRDGYRKEEQTEMKMVRE